MSKETLKTPDEWSEIIGIKIIDPDGWRQEDKDFNNPITEDDFISMAMRSTVRHDFSKYDEWKNKKIDLKSKTQKAKEKNKAKRKKNNIKFSNKVALFKVEGDDDYRFVEIYDKRSDLEMPEFDIAMPLPARESFDQLEEFGGF